MSVVSRPCFSNSPASFMIHGTACEPAMALQPKTSLSAALEEPGRESTSKNQNTTSGVQHDVVRFGSDLLKQSIFILLAPNEESRRARLGSTIQWLQVSPALPFAGTDTGYRFDLDENLRGRKASDFNQGRAWEIPAKDLLPPAPLFGVFLDVDDVNVHLHDVRHGTSRGLYEAADLTEDHFCLLIFIAALDGHAVAAASNHAGDEEHVTDAQSVGPSNRWRVSDMGARYYLD